MRRDVGVGMAAQAAFVRDLDPAENELAPLFQRVNVEALSDAVLQWHPESAVAGHALSKDGTGVKFAALTTRNKRSKLARGGWVAMPAFAKSPKFMIGTIIVLWLVYIIYENFQLPRVEIHLLPFGLLILQLPVSAILIGAAIFGAIATLVIQWLWKRRSSKNNSASAPASASSARTVA